MVKKRKVVENLSEDSVYEKNKRGLRSLFSKGGSAKKVNVRKMAVSEVDAPKFKPLRYYEVRRKKDKQEVKKSEKMFLNPPEKRVLDVGSKKFLVGGLVFVILIIILLFVVYFYLLFFPSSARKLELGENIDSAYVNEDVIYVKLLPVDYSSINITHFVLIDYEGNRYFYSTSSAGLKHVIRPGDVSLENFDNISGIGADFDYLPYEPVVREEPNDTSEESPPAGWGKEIGGGGGGSPGPVLSCTDDSGCSSVGDFCDGQMSYSCSLGVDGCFDRTNKTFCGGGQVCLNGECQIIIDCVSDFDCVSYFDSCSYGVCNASGKCEVRYNSTVDVCRESGGECDVVEFCDGFSGECPVDVLRDDGSVCSFGVCVSGECVGCVVDGDCPSDGCYSGEFRNYSCVSGNCSYVVVEVSEGVSEGNCGDGLDNDCDGLVDDEDSGCSGTNDSGAVEVSSCGVLDSPNEVYVLTQDVSAMDYSSFCFSINAENVTLDCQGNIIKGSFFSNDIVLIKASGVVVENCRVSSGSFGSWAIALDEGSNVIIRDNVISGCDKGILVSNRYSTNNLIFNNTINNADPGIDLRISKGNNVSSNVVCSSEVYDNDIWCYPGQFGSSNTCDELSYKCDVACDYSCEVGSLSLWRGFKGFFGFIG